MKTRKQFLTRLALNAGEAPFAMGALTISLLTKNLERKYSYEH
jgi:hypothetical protein